MRSWSRTTANSSGKKIGLVSEAPAAGWAETLRAKDTDLFIHGFFGHDWSDAVVKIGQTAVFSKMTRVKKRNIVTKDSKHQHCESRRYFAVSSFVVVW